MEFCIKMNTYAFRFSFYMEPIDDAIIQNVEHRLHSLTPLHGDRTELLNHLRLFTANSYVNTVFTKHDFPPLITHDPFTGDLRFTTIAAPRIDIMHGFKRITAPHLAVNNNLGEQMQTYNAFSNELWERCEKVMRLMTNAIIMQIIAPRLLEMIYGPLRMSSRDAELRLPIWNGQMLVYRKALPAMYSLYLDPLERQDLMAASRTFNYAFRNPDYFYNLPQQGNYRSDYLKITSNFKLKDQIDLHFEANQPLLVSDAMRIKEMSKVFLVNAPVPLFNYQLEMVLGNIAGSGLNEALDYLNFEDQTDCEIIYLFKFNLNKQYPLAPLGERIDVMDDFVYGTQTVPYWIDPTLTWNNLRWKLFNYDENLNQNNIAQPLIPAQPIELHGHGISNFERGLGQYNFMTNYLNNLFSNLF